MVSGNWIDISFIILNMLIWWKRSLQKLLKLCDTIKDQTRGNTIKFTSLKQKKQNEMLSVIESRLIWLEDERDRIGTEFLNTSISHTRDEIDEIIEEKTRGGRIWCKVK